MPVLPHRDFRTGQGFLGKCKVPLMWFVVHRDARDRFLINRDSRIAGDIRWRTVTSSYSRVKHIATFGYSSECEPAPRRRAGY